MAPTRRQSPIETNCPPPSPKPPRQLQLAPDRRVFQNTSTGRCQPRSFSTRHHTIRSSDAACGRPLEFYRLDLRLDDATDEARPATKELPSYRQGKPAQRNPQKCRPPGQQPKPAHQWSPDPPIKHQSGDAEHHTGRRKYQWVPNGSSSSPRYPQARTFAQLMASRRKDAQQILLWTTHLQPLTQQAHHQR